MSPWPYPRAMAVCAAILFVLAVMALVGWAFQSALLTITIVVGFTALLAQMARSLNLSERDHGRLLEERVRTEEANASLRAQDAARRALHESEERFRAFMDFGPTIAWMEDADGHFVYLSHAAEETFGIDETSAKGAYAADVLPRELAATSREVTKSVLASGIPAEHTISFRGLDGVERAWLIFRFPVRGSGTKLLGATAIDVTARARAEEQLAKARDAALQASRLKSEFLANMSHELRTPLNGVIGMLGLLTSTKLDEEQLSYAEAARGSGEALLGIISDILDFSKIEAGRMELEILVLDVRETLDDVLEGFAERALSRGLELGAMVDPDVPAHVKGDPGRVRQILNNFIGNALKFTSEGEVVVHVRREGDDGTSLLRFEVRDTGIGIPDEARARLFQSFSQVDGSTTRRFGGTGLGLAISKQLAELMGGAVGVESTLGVGSTFWFTARLEPAETEPGGAEIAARPRIDGRRVLVVDDRPAGRAIVAHGVTSLGGACTSVDAVEAALDALQRAHDTGVPFDTIIVDQELPARDGIDLVRTMRSDPRFEGVSAVLLSPFGRAVSSDVSRDLRITAVLAKPVRAGHLAFALAGRPDSRPPSTPSDAGSPISTARLAAQSRRALGSQRRVAGVGDTGNVGRDGTGGARGTWGAGARRTAFRVLVAEDNVVNQQVASRTLQKLGYTADVVADGAEAVTAVRLVPYDVVLMDCQMPHMDGFEATRAIRAMEGPARDIVVIALTANARTEDRARCLAAGMNDYVSKPVRAEDLESVLGRWLRARAPRGVASAGRIAAPSGAAAPAQSAAMPAAVAAPSTSRPEGSLPADEAEREGWSEVETLDRKLLVSLRGLAVEGEPDVLIELLDLFVGAAPKRLAAMRDAVSQHDAAALAHQAHSLKGSAGCIGAAMLSRKSAELEVLGPSTTESWEQARAAVAGLEALYGETIRALRAEVGAA